MKTVAEIDYYHVVSHLLSLARSGNDLEPIYAQAADLPTEFGIILVRELFHLNHGSILGEQALSWMNSIRALLISPDRVEVGSDIEKALSTARASLLLSDSMDAIFFGHLSLNCDWQVPNEFTSFSSDQRIGFLIRTMMISLPGVPEIPAGFKLDSVIFDSDCSLEVITFQGNLSEISAGIENSICWTNRWGQISKELSKILEVSH